MSPRILAIDDSRTIRAMLRLTLGRAGFEVHTAADGRAAVDRLDALAPDLVITDLNMPRLDGFGVIAAIRRHERYTGLPILVLSTENARDLKDRARALGATGWIVKPFEEARLIAAIRRVAGAAR
ncbi:response regulator [Roseivivax sp. CAU 1761]